MSTRKKRLSVGLSEEDYQWLDEKAELTGNSRAAVLRQIVRGLRLRRPGLLNLGDGKIIFADDPIPTGEADSKQENQQNQEQVNDAEDSGLEAFSTQE